MKRISRTERSSTSSAISRSKAENINYTFIMVRYIFNTQDVADALDVLVVSLDKGRKLCPICNWPNRDSGHERFCNLF